MEMIVTNKVDCVVLDGPQIRYGGSNLNAVGVKWIS